MATEQQVKEFGAYLAGLDDEERVKALAQAKMLGVTQAPDDKIGKPPLRPLGQYLREKIPEPPSLVTAATPVTDELTGQVVRGAITLTTAPGGKGKTVLSLSRLLRWAAGMPLFDDLKDVQIPTQPLRSIIIENEGAAGFFQSRLQRQVDGLEVSADQKKLIHENIAIWGDGGWSSMKIDNPENKALIRRACEEFKPDILFMEPLRGLHRADENSNTDMGNVIDDLNGIASDYDCAVLLTHHERKSGASGEEDPMFAVRGGGVLTDLVGVVERFKAVKAGTQRQVEWTKSRFGPAPPPIRMKFDPIRWCYTHVSMTDAESIFLGVLEENPSEWYSVPDLAELCSETEDHVRKLANSLAKDGRVKKIKNPHQPEGRGSAGFLYRSNTGDSSGSGGMEIA